MYKIATPISDLFGKQTDAESIMRHSDCLECRDHSIERTYPAEEVFHSEIQPIHGIKAEEMARLKCVANNKPGVRLVTFHMASSCDEPVLSGYMYVPGGRQKSRGELLECAAENMAKIRKVFGDEVLLALENNNYYPNAAYEHVTEPEFVSEVVESNNVFFLLDLAHAKITCHNAQRSYADYLRALPLNRMIQVHLSSPANDEKTGLAYDHHGLPSEEDLAEAVSLAKASPNLTYFTVEHYISSSGLVNSLRLLREKINELSE